jgi:N-glycosyltransferase
LLQAEGNDVFNRVLFKNYLIGPHTAKMARDVVAIAEKMQPDVIMHDCSEFGGYLAAEMLEVPHVSLDNGLTRLVCELHDVYEPELNSVRRALGLPPEPDYPGSHKYLVATPAPPEFLLHDLNITTLRAHQHVNPVRSGERAPRWLTEVDPHEPLIYVSLGSLGVCAPALTESVMCTYDAILAALSEFTCTAVVAVGPGNVRRFGKQAKHIYLLGHAPQTLLLRTADLFVGHAGFGGLREAADAGVPLVLLPYFADQPNNARRCTELGLGVDLDPKSVTADKVYNACKMVLSDPSYQAVARRLQRAFLALAPLDENHLPSVGRCQVVEASRV